MHMANELLSVPVATGTLGPGRLLPQIKLL